MSEQTIWDAIETQFALLPNIDMENVAWSGRKFVPQAETPYLATSMPAIGAKNLTAGTAGILEWTGTFQVTCNWPIGAGRDSVTAQRDQIRALFPQGLCLPTADGWWVKFYSPTVKPLLMDGAWNIGIVQMPWFLDEITA